MPIDVQPQGISGHAKERVQLQVGRHACGDQRREEGAAGPRNSDSR